MAHKTEKANYARNLNADEFARKIIKILDDIENINNYKFKSLSDRCFALNTMKIKTRRGGSWQKTQISRILKRTTK